VGAAACGTAATSASSAPTSAAGSAAPQRSGAFPTSTGAAPATQAAYPSYAPWPEAGHDPRRSGASPARGPATGATRWVRDLGAGITTGPVIGSDGTIYVASSSGVLHALDPATGADRWTFSGTGAYEGAGDLSTSPAILPGGTIVWPGPGNTLYALDPSGHQLWSMAFAAMPLSPAVASAGKVYVADMAANLTAVDITSTGGKRLWTVALGRGSATSFGSPAIGPDGTVYGTVGRQAVAVADRGGQGQVLWRFTVGSDIEVSPAVGPDGTVVVGTNDPYQYGLSPTGQLRWRVRRQSQTYSSTAVTADGLAYYGDNNGVVYVAKSAGGSPVVQYRGVHGVWAEPVIDSAHNVYFGTQGGHIYGFGYGGTRLFDVNAHSAIDSYPALGADGTLYIGTEQGKLYAING
jgi:outer membrane protein assembly factor BamB